MRKEGRQNDQLRPVTITPGFVEMPAGSALIEMGQTRLICTASVENRLPAWLHQAQLKQSDKSGWVTGEYSILPGAGPSRTPREATRGRKSGRTYEIQRLIGRSLRAVADLNKIGPRTIWIDCDVVEADGGTRTAAITGGYVALRLALRDLLDRGVIEEDPILDSLAAVSVGIVDGEAMLDLNYDEDSRADVDLNLVMTGKGEIVEVQATAEKISFPRDRLEEMVSLGAVGIEELLEIQEAALSK